MLKQRKTPLRKCSGCGEMKSKQELIRVVKNKEGEVSLDLTSKKAGQRRVSLPLVGMFCHRSQSPPI